MIIKENNPITTMNNFPYFTPEQMLDLGVYSKRRYGVEADNIYIDENNKITSLQWFNNYKLYYYGLVTEKKDELVRMRVNKLLDLYSDFEKIKESGDINMINARKQSILELGWNPEIKFNPDNRAGVDLYVKSEACNRILETEDITGDNLVITEAKKEGKIPIFVVLTYTFSAFGRVIKNVTNGLYSHAAFAFDSTLKKTYSFNADVNGFSLESIDRYTNEHKDGIMAVYAVFVDKVSYNKISNKIDELLLNSKTTSYGFLTALGTVLNTPIEIANSMICSQFVDSLFKMINIDITHKQSALVTPNDFYLSHDNKMYMVYEGKIAEYNHKKVDSQLLKLHNPKAVVNEVKEFPAGFDKDGNLLIKNIKRLNYRDEFEKSHKLLKIYEKDNNTYGMAYEICKLWFINTELEKKIYYSNLDKEKKDEYYVLRSQVLNDFNKYLRQVQQDQKDFNFTDYYNNTPFSDASIKIDKYTIEYGSKLIKNLLL